MDNPTSDLIVSDFAACKDDVDALLVHCLRGRNRSPAAAFALHEVFDLGNDLKKLREPYKPDEPNWYVYQQIVEAGKRYFECQPQS